MKIPSNSLLAFALVICIACSKNDDPAATKQCYPSRFIQTEDGILTSATFTYTFASDGKATGVLITNEQSGDVFSITVEYAGPKIAEITMVNPDGSNYDVTFTYDGSNRIAEVFRNGFQWYKMEYNSDQTVKKILYYDSGDPNDPMGGIGLNIEYTLAYASGTTNASSITGINHFYPGTVTRTYTYDDHKMPFSDLEPLWTAFRIAGQINDAFGPLLDDFRIEFFNANNVITRSGGGETATFTYQYNADGYPSNIVAVITENGASYTHSTTYEYTCH